MNRRLLFLLQHAAGCVLGLSLCLHSPLARAASVQAFEMALDEALAKPHVRAGGTVFGQPLMTAGNIVETFLPTTLAAIDAVVRLIEGAQHEVLLQTYECHDGDEAAQKVLAALRARAQVAVAQRARPPQPLAVRILTSQAWMAENKLSQRALHAWIAEVGADPAYQGRFVVDWATYRGSPLAILHSKTVVVDAARALVMTGNLHTHGGGKLEQDNVNMAVQLAGPMVQGLRADWHHARALGTLEVASDAMQLASFASTSAAMSAATPHARAIATDLTTPATAPAPETCVAAILSRPSHWSYWDVGGSNPQAQGLLALIDAATVSIDVLNPSVNVPALQQALVRAIVERGVHVRLLVSLEMNRQREHRFFGGDNAEQAQKLYADVLRQGGAAAVRKLVVGFASLDGVHPSSPSSCGNVHAKVASFDQTVLLIGSTNWNWLSWNNGRELSVALLSPMHAEAFSRTSFAQLWARSVRYGG